MRVLGWCRAVGKDLEPDLKPERCLDVRDTGRGTEAAPTQEVRKVAHCSWKAGAWLGGSVPPVPCQAQTRATGRSSFPAPEEGLVPALPAAPQPPPLCQASRRISPAGSVSQGNVISRRAIQLWRRARLQRGDSCVPQTQPRSRLPEPTETVAEAELAGVRGPGRGRDRPVVGLHLPARSGPHSPHRPGRWSCSVFRSLSQDVNVHTGIY